MSTVTSLAGEEVTEMKPAEKLSDCFVELYAQALFFLRRRLVNGLTVLNRESFTGAD